MAPAGLRKLPGQADSPHEDPGAKRTAASTTTPPLTGSQTGLLNRFTTTKAQLRTQYGLSSAAVIQLAEDNITAALLSGHVRPKSGQLSNQPHCQLGNLLGRAMPRPARATG